MTKRSLQSIIVIMGILLVLIPIALWVGSNGCVSSIAIKCTSAGLSINITNGTGQDYALASQTISTLAIVRIISVICGIIGAVIAVFNKQTAELWIAITRRSTRIKFKLK